jgi:hypothetical protein
MGWLASIFCDGIVDGQQDCALLELWRVSMFPETPIPVNRGLAKEFPTIFMVFSKSTSTFRENSFGLPQKK